LIFIDLQHEDELRYIGMVVSGEKISSATDALPSPRDIAVFSRLKYENYMLISNLLQFVILRRYRRWSASDCSMSNGWSRLFDMA
jgi:hypothetical protein